MVDWRMPQMILTRLDGSREPSELSIPRTKVAESADVMKKVMIKIRATTASIVPQGRCSSARNKAVEISFCTASPIGA